MPTSPIDMVWDYRKGMPSRCSEALRVLRNQGFAVAIIRPEVVGQPIHRGRVEQAMIAAGEYRAREMQTFKVRGVR
jgi:hypothetical protein